MAQIGWIDKVFSFFKKSPMGAYRNECWDSLSPSEKGAKGGKLALNYCKKELGFRLITEIGDIVAVKLI